MRLTSRKRRRAISLLHRFFRTAMTLGRMPSLLGREFFRMRHTRRPTGAVEEDVHFVCDVERSLAALSPLGQRLVAFCILEDRSEWEASRYFHSSQGFISRHLGVALDDLYASFCGKGLMLPVPDEPEHDAETHSELELIHGGNTQ